MAGALEEIPIVMSADNNYTWIARCALYSIMKSRNRDTCYHFYLLQDNSLTEESRQQLSGLKSKFPELIIDFLSVDQEKFRNAKVTTEHLTKAAYYRLFISELLDRLDRCIYLDCDVLVLEDLKKLWETDLGENYIGAVKNWNFQQKTEYMEKRRQTLGIPSMNQYINSGVLILNLKRLREDRMTVRFRQHMAKSYPSEDQDVLNVCCYGKICFLPVKFNLYNRYSGKTDRIRGEIYADPELEEAERQPAIIHFAGGVTKPWNNMRCLWADKWWRLAAEAMEEVEYNLRLEAARQKTEENDFDSFIRFCRGKEKLIIYGFTELGRKLYQTLRNQGIGIQCFCDGDSKKQKETFEGAEVLNIHQVLEEAGSDITIINVCRKNGEQVRTELLRLGIREEQIYAYSENRFRRTAVYYVALDPAWYEKEMEQICRMEGYENRTCMPWTEWLSGETARIETLKEKYHLHYWAFPPYQIV